MRVSAEGVVTRTIDVEPNEWCGMSLPQITDGLLKLFREIDPGVSFFDVDVRQAAVDIHERFDVSTERP